ncbi:spinster family MFS transporter [Croceicoccus marinus]|uniref:MFS transporter n=1 Tax=Croceicoccus marinus TaxID=450378 RepID=A0A1Z1FGP1_9SPHN|nr:MFS transporter [Croceicoccus marinus]ARU17877.1 MFS transporter [Croceicoccus marinus]QNE07384.1 MFS transporter [Croceicoccus marinus]
MIERRDLPRSPGAVLAMLLLVYIFNFLDRQILAILAAPIQADLGLSDAQMGLLGGLAFALLYSTLAVPLASLADRTSRSWVITISLVVWSGFTAACALAQGFWHIFFARLGVGVGEAGGVAPSYALIGDYFPPKKRSLALAIYSMGIPLGSAGGILAGGWIAATIDWRLAFVVVGCAGVIIAPLFKLVVRDLPRPVAAATDVPDAARIATVARILARKPSFWLLSFGAASGSMLGYGILFWKPSLMIRSFGLDLLQTSWFLGALMLVGGVIGTLTGGLLGDRMGARDKAWYARLPAMAYAIATPFFVAAIFMTDNLGLAFALFLIPQAMAYVWLGPVLTAVQHLVAPAQRSTASALFLLINNLLGLGGGIYVLGQMSDLLAPQFGTESLRWSMIFGQLLYLVAAVLMLLASRRLRQDWVEEA